MSAQTRPGNEGNGFISKMATGATQWSTRWVPDAYVLAIILTVIAALLAIAFTDHGPIQLVEDWGKGFWTLLSFSMQMALVIFTGYIVAVAPPMQRLLNHIAGYATSPKQAITLMALISMILAFFNWGISIVGSAVLVRAMAKKVKGVDYRLLVACAYLGMGCTWHSGLSASAPLLVATPGHFMEKAIGIIPVTQTIFSPFNLITTAVVVIVMTIVAPMLHPAEKDTVTVDPAVLADMKDFEKPVRAEKTPASGMEFSPIMSIIIGLMGVIYLFLYFKAKGVNGIDINTVNFIFLVLGIILHGTPASLLKAAEEAGTNIWGVILQFPFYAGIFGVVQYSGLSDIIGDFFVSFATGSTYPLIIYWYSGILNYIVPSGGSKFAIEAPYIMAAADKLGVTHSITLIAYAWGDMFTDIIQPFWAIPLLGVARLKFRDIMGYCIVFFLFFAVITTIAFWLGPILGA